MKKFLMVLLSLLLIFSSTACKTNNNNTSDNNTDAPTNDYQGLVFYPQDDGTYVVSGGNAKYMKNITIPEKYNGGDVVKIEEDPLKDFKTLESIVIPNSVTEIDQGIFTGCTNLKSISMPGIENTHSFLWLFVDSSKNSISSDEYIDLPPIEAIHITGGTTINNGMFSLFIGEDQFKSTLKTLTLPNTITSIGEDAFRSCPDSIFEEENGIKYIDKWAVSCTSVDFTLRNDTIGIASYALKPKDTYNENITSFTVPASVKYLSPLALAISPNISEYYVDSKNSNYCAVDGIVYTKDMDTLVQHPCAKEQNDFVFHSNTKTIFAGAFAVCKLGNLSLPSGMTEIPYQAFYFSSLTSLSIPSSVKKIGEMSFALADISTINLPEGITEIPYGAFGSSNLSSITIPNSVTSIGSSAFSGCSNLTSVTIPNSVTSIGSSAFAECDSLTSVTIPNSVTSIGSSAFSFCDSLKTVKLPNGITEIADSTFSNCNELTSVNIPDSVIKIGNSAFSQCQNLIFVRLPKNLTSIGDTAFYYCNLLSINIPNSLNYIGEDAFYNCNIMEIIKDSNWHLNISIGSTDNGYLAYNAIEIHSGESKIVNYNNYLFYTCNSTNYLLKYTGNETDLYLPEYYYGQNYEIYRKAFYNRNEYNNNAIYNVIIPDSVTKIGDLAFFGCNELTEIVIGANVSSFGNQAFDYCSNLEKVYYKGTDTSWNKINKYGYYLFTNIIESPRYYYSETEPASTGNYWHYVNGVPTIWE